MSENDQLKESRVEPFQIGMKVLIFNPHGEILLLKRNPEAYGDGKDYWDIPGGRVSNSIDVDSIMKGGAIHPELNRELQEEIGWTPSNDDELAFVSRQQIVTSKNEDVDRLTFSVHVDQDFNVRLSPEHTDYK